MTEETILMAHVQRVLAADASGHSLDHIQRVVATTRTLLAQTPEADARVAVAAAMLHDTYDDKLVADVPAAKAATQAAMTAAGLRATEQTAILTIIDHMSFKHSLAGHQVLSLEGQLVQDADRLDAIGAIGIARTMMYGGAHASKLYDPALPPRTALTAATYRNEESTIINHFHEKLLTLAAQMNTPAAKRIAAHRQQVMLDFLAEFTAEWQGQS
ncbi:HD domain-containing protein [Lacticaseibacillus absianus]|uniref:HD domain-containing protein n=1 Tax=Lacticaseibacillus absianus TaxID=2729623 RepID=UPI0015C9915A|nr:HD domain-containing protein [Lacticaseibacillus absianus]